MIILNITQLEQRSTSMSVNSITPQRLHELITKGDPAELIDVRTPVEFREVHVTIARNIPLTELDAKKIAATRSNEKTLYVICKSGGRGRQACEQLIAAGHSNIVNVDGGTQAWDAAGLPVIRGKKAMSLERQVRIAAGSLVLAGAVLSQLVHPWWIGLSGFVGAGLIFAGITDTCGMGMMLARMPWNRVS
jgi:rhodanese-related sulfurtransferase